MAKNLQGEPKWLAGKVIERTGPVSYRVEVRGKIRHRHVDQLLATGVQAPDRSPEENITLPVDWPQPSDPASDSSETTGTQNPDNNSPTSNPDESTNSPVSEISRYPRRD